MWVPVRPRPLPTIASQTHRCEPWAHVGGGWAPAGLARPVTWAGIAVSLWLSLTSKR